MKRLICKGTMKTLISRDSHVRTDGHSRPVALMVCLHVGSPTVDLKDLVLL